MAREVCWLTLLVESFTSGCSTTAIAISSRARGKSSNRRPSANRVGKPRRNPSSNQGLFLEFELHLLSAEFSNVIRNRSRKRLRLSIEIESILGAMERLSLDREQF